MKYQLDEDDYLTLWKYFNDKATNVKGAMFNTLTWIIGFATALLGFVSLNLTNYNSDNAVISLPLLMVVSAIAGLFICVYAWFTLQESAKHIQNNWDYANNCRKEIDGLKKLIKPKKKKTEMMAIWNRLGLIVVFFAIAFLVILILAFFI